MSAREERKHAEQHKSIVHRKFQPLRDKLQQNEIIVQDFSDIEKVSVGSWMAVTQCCHH